ncbi:ABC transporter ATP-binding protein [Abyssisolibacter fermentans]|uniref:ABC transporter ATP-binding protein n=1 Tax=Abyssisolibacter fermentans TaxID=1766203 RepID=UPI00082DF333|nr:ABC transporter ATP-binding protein [Abyssisolibacter fermentans]
MVVKCIKPYIKKYFLLYLIGVVGLFIVDYFQVKIPAIIGATTDGISLGIYTNQDIYQSLYKLVSIAVIIIIGRFIWRYFIFGTARKIEYHLRNDFFKHLEKLSLRYFNQNKTGDLMAHATNDLNTVRMALGQGLLFAFDFTILISLVIYRMINDISISLTLVAVIPLPFIAVFGVGFGKVMINRFRAKQEAFSKMSEQVQENISGIRVIKAFTQESNERNAFDEVNKYNFTKNIQVVKLFAFLHPFITLISGLSTMLTIGYGGYLTMIGSISLGQFIAFTQYLGMLVWPMMAFSMTINMFSQGFTSAKRIQNILDVKPEIVDSNTMVKFDKLKGNIKFDNLTFDYPNGQKGALKDIKVEIKQGQTIGIIGRTGSGKTTFVNLLLRLYNPKKSTLFIDGVDILDIPLKTLRREIGYVPQDNYLFSNTIKNNILFGARDKNQSQVEKAANMSDVHDNIVDFPDKYETIIGERGTTLSGGQKQRVSIARALIKDPSILILDDAVSAVDTKTEEKILSELEQVRMGKTTIIIAHRISTLKQADKILVIDEGDIIEQGTNDELIALDGLYADMVRKQQLEKALEDEA